MKRYWCLKRDGFDTSKVVLVRRKKEGDSTFWTPGVFEDSEKERSRVKLIQAR